MTATDLAHNYALTAAKAASDKLARDISIRDVSDQMFITDVFVIASAPNDRQINAIVDSVESELIKQHDARPLRREGKQGGRWVLLDYGDIVVHVQHTEEREFYGLDGLWKDCPAIPFEDVVPAGEDGNTAAKRAE
ncbi:ribosome silencing factor [Natronoglycomyces albus]|uniref:Ribosomal silencing factor RsfS n=1 Tax=Natronoglycomyces albus TaxID=2811108 RepID=A0A895XGL2_9ACTN|nr:ribosome silencing factor [Natronoglycomyces albus]QSB04484.1 ribosome silencing factor [Natronoglycomyces albus]